MGGGRNGQTKKKNERQHFKSSVYSGCALDVDLMKNLINFRVYGQNKIQKFRKDVGYVGGLPAVLLILLYSTYQAYSNSAKPCDTAQFTTRNWPIQRVEHIDVKKNVPEKN